MPDFLRSSLIALAVSLAVVPAMADGHGASFAFSTATLGAGDTGIETGVMWRSGTYMLAPHVTYGVSENLQVSFSSPFHVNHGEHPTGRFEAMMPGNPEAEFLLGWRFYHASTGVGTRNEATVYAGGSALTQEVPRADGPPLRRQPGLYVALAAGRVARSYDVWAGIGYQKYGEWNSGIDDHQSNTLLTSFAAGWRPSFLNKDYPKPDIRIFWETIGEEVGIAWRDRPPAGFGTTGGGGGHTHSETGLPVLPKPSAIEYLRNVGGNAIFSGPSLLCTYHSMAFQGGILFPLMDNPNGHQPPEHFRVSAGVTYYFLGRRHK
jgi:hypothetical protein